MSLVNGLIKVTHEKERKKDENKIMSPCNTYVLCRYFVTKSIHTFRYVQNSIAK